MQQERQIDAGPGEVFARELRKFVVAKSTEHGTTRTQPGGRRQRTARVPTTLPPATGQELLAVGRRITVHIEHLIDRDDSQANDVVSVLPHGILVLLPAACSAAQSTRGTAGRRL